MSGYPLPSHIGIRRNETADNLANRATQNTEIDLDIGLELAEAYALVENYTLQKWQNMWTNGTTGSHYRQIQKTVSKKVKYENVSRYIEVVITRLKFGKCRLNYYLHQIKKHLDGLCEICKKKPETVIHFLLECPTGDTCSSVLRTCIISLF